MTLSLLTFIVALLAFREYCARRTLPQIHHADFKGEVMHVGSRILRANLRATVATKPSSAFQASSRTCATFKVCITTATLSLF